MLLAYCGIDCHRCPCYTATQTNDTQKHMQLLETWPTKNQTITPQDLVCDGCHGPRVSRDCQNCWIKKCATQRNHENCSHCTQFPCQRLQHEWNTWKVLSGDQAKKRLQALINHPDP